MNSEKCINQNCGCPTISSSTVYWCKKCNIPLFEKECTICGEKGKYITTDMRPVFPEEKLLLALIKEKPFDYYEKKSVWYGSNSYIVDGKKEAITLGKINKWSLEKIKEIKDNYERHKNIIKYDFFNEIVERFIKANRDRYNFITEEAVNYIQSYKERYAIEDMLVSFSGGKDSTVTSHLVNRALGTNKVLHIFGDTTLEFPYTLEYKKRFNKNEESKGVRVLTAKNREKNFEELCQLVGPPSRVMRWCCTVFKTGAIQKTIASAFKDKTNILTFQGIRHSESVSRSKYERESESPKISKQTVASPIIDWFDFDVWLYILTTGIDFNDAYRLGFSRVGCWCCPNNGAWSEFLSKIHMYEQYVHWNSSLVEFAKKIGKPDPEEYVSSGGWKARQGGNGLEVAQKTIVSFEPCATEENAFNYELQRPITEELYEYFKPFGYINKELGNKRLGEVYIIDRKGQVILILQGRVGKNKLKVTIKNIHIAGAKSLKNAEARIQCQLTKYQMCLGCKACEGVCKHDAISVKDDGKGNISYSVDNNKCVRCGECVSHFTAGCYMRKVLMIKRG
ncbi:MAG: phosphoadenosine phosphosulfate reductase family protein [Eubacterium sp.]